MRSARVAAVLDVCCVLVFVIIGRASHTRGETLAGIASTSWPFLCGLAVGWAWLWASAVRMSAVRMSGAAARRRPFASPASRRAGLRVWLCTVAVGMILRVISGQGTAIAFIIVALAFLGLFLLGWRLASRTMGMHSSGAPFRRHLFMIMQAPAAFLAFLYIYGQALSKGAFPTE